VQSPRSQHAVASDLRFSPACSNPRCLLPLVASTLPADPPLFALNLSTPSQSRFLGQRFHECQLNRGSTMAPLESVTPTFASSQDSTPQIHAHVQCFGKHVCNACIWIIASRSCGNHGPGLSLQLLCTHSYIPPGTLNACVIVQCIGSVPYDVRTLMRYK
jgi:hypothetical protein